MNPTRLIGRILLTIGVIGIGLWATREKLLDLPPYAFWTSILCYLLGAHLALTLAERQSGQGRDGLTRQGLCRLTRRAGGRVTNPLWLYDGGRLRLADIAAANDFVRDTHQGLLTALLTRESGPRLHLITGEPGTGRSCLLLRLGQALAEQNQTVFSLLPGPDVTALGTVIEAARRGQVYLLADDLDLRPQAEEWLYEIFRAALPVVVVATARSAPEVDPEHDGLNALQPANFLSQASLHKPRLTANDLGALARRLAALGRQVHPGLAAEGAGDFVTATRYLQGCDPAANLWEDLDHAPALPLHQKLLLALCGMAELALPLPLANALLGDKALPAWQKAGLLSVENGLALPPHHHYCRDLLQKQSHGGVSVRGALEALVNASLPISPAFAPRLLLGLSADPGLAALARDQVTRMSPAVPHTDSPAPVQRLWRRVLEALQLPAVSPAEVAQYPPMLSLLVDLAFARGDYEAALESSRALALNSVYEAPAQFNIALALVHLGRLEEAEQQLAALRHGPPGTLYLRGVIAEARGDYVAALDAYEASRKADELQLASTRRLAFCYVRSGAPRAAIPLFEAVLVYTPRRADLYGGLAVAHLHSGMAQRAAAQSARAIQAGVEPVTARKAVARACAEAHAFDRAASELEACVSYDANDAEAWRELATACRWLGRFDREEECLRRLQLTQPESAEVRFEMARCQRDQGRAAETMKLLAPLLAADQPSLPVLLLAAEASGSLGEPARQEQYARLALAAGDGSGWGHYWLADSFTEASVEAREAYGRAIEAFKNTLAEGLTPRRAARLWQAVYFAARALGDESLAAQADRKARQEVTVCEALGAEIESVTHRRSVPSDVFLESLTPPADTPDGASAGPGHTDPRPPPGQGQVEAPVLRTRFPGRTHIRGQ